MPSFNFLGRRMDTAYDHFSEDEDKLLDEPHDQNPELRKLEQANKNLRTVLGVLLGLFCILAAWITSKNWTPQLPDLMIPQILKTPVPQMPLKTEIFERNPLYASRPDADSDAAWNALLPLGRGFVYVPDSSSYSLPPGESTFYGEIYSVSLFHQLHCLGQLRKYYWMLIDGVAENKTSLRPMVDALLGPQGEHVSHCFDYLRQSLQCAGDMALEWPRVEEDGRRFAVDGWGIPHECRSWDHIVDYMKGSYFNMSTNADIAPDHPMPAGQSG